MAFHFSGIFICRVKTSIYFQNVYHYFPTHTVAGTPFHIESNLPPPNRDLSTPQTSPARPSPPLSDTAAPVTPPMTQPVPNPTAGPEPTPTAESATEHITTLPVLQQITPSPAPPTPPPSSAVDECPFAPTPNFRERVDKLVGTLKNVYTELLYAVLVFH